MVSERLRKGHGPESKTNFPQSAVPPRLSPHVVEREYRSPARPETFIDSTGIQALVATKQQCEAHGTRLSLRVGASQVAQMLSIAGVAEYLGEHRHGDAPEPAGGGSASAG